MYVFVVLPVRFIRDIAVCLYFGGLRGLCSFRLVPHFLGFDFPWRFIRNISTCFHFGVVRGLCSFRLVPAVYGCRLVGRLG